MIEALEQKGGQLTNYEIMSVSVSLLATVVAVVSLVRTRKISAQQIELERITADLSKKETNRGQTTDYAATNEDAT